MSGEKLAPKGPTNGLVRENSKDEKEKNDVIDDSFIIISDIGSGKSSKVFEMKHKQTKKLIAVKKIYITNADKESFIKDVSVLHNYNKCPYIVHFFGYLNVYNDVFIYSDLMTMCFNKLLKLTPLTEQIKTGIIPERILGNLTFCTLNALQFIQVINVGKESRKTGIHGNIKPSNLLINKEGEIKLCDFTNSNSFNSPEYMAPEIFQSTGSVFDIRADFWSLSITLLELATGEYPYKTRKNPGIPVKPYEIMLEILNNKEPTLEGKNGLQFSKDFKNFVTSCLKKTVTDRPNVETLLISKFVEYKNENVKEWFEKILDGNKKNKI
jgi:serine/threonine protein kinase